LRHFYLLLDFTKSLRFSNESRVLLLEGSDATTWSNIFSNELSQVGPIITFLALEIDLF
jgi:hypothetical protein